MRALLLFLLLALSVIADDASFVWDANTEPDIAGYRLHYGPSVGSYTNMVDVGNVTTATVSNLPPGSTIYFVATAYNTSYLESEHSEPVIVRTRLSAPKNFKSINSQLQAASSPVGPWRDFVSYPPVELPIVEGVQFYRMLLSITDNDK